MSSAHRKSAEADLLDSVQKHGANDATSLPDAREAPQIDAPLLLQALGADDGHPLSVAANL